MMRVFRRALLATFVATTLIPLFSQDTTVQDMRNEIILLEGRLDSLKILHEQIMSKADDLANQIEQLKMENKLNHSVHKNLERRLQQSQQLERKLKNVEVQINEILKLRKQKIEELVSIYQHNIDRLVEKIDRGEEKNDSLLYRIDKLYIEKQSLAAKLSTRKRVVVDTKIDTEIKPWDTAQDIRLKRDLLLDREEALRKEVAVIDKWIKTLEEEHRVRRKVSELISEMDAFSEREELLGRDIKVRGSLTVTNKGERDNRTAAMDRYSIPITELYLENGNFSLPETRPHSIEEIENWINQLKKYKNSVIIKADSLKNRAKLLDHQVQTMHE